jgi:hypothetical protein
MELKTIYWRPKNHTHFLPSTSQAIQPKQAQTLLNSTFLYLHFAHKSPCSDGATPDPTPLALPTLRFPAPPPPPSMVPTRVRLQNKTCHQGSEMKTKLFCAHHKPLLLPDSSSGGRTSLAFTSSLPVILTNNVDKNKVGERVKAEEN